MGSLELHPGIDNIVRSAKSGSDWTETQLFQYNVRIDIVDCATFFGIPALPQPTISPTILNHLIVPPGPLPKVERQFFLYLRDATRAGSEEACVDDFASHILRLLDYDGPDSRVIHPGSGCTPSQTFASQMISILCSSYRKTR